MSEGVDFSWARPGGAAIAAAGKKFVMRYLYPDGQGSKGLDLSEVTDYRAHGLQIGVVFETSATRTLSGFAAGVADAHTSAAQLASLGMTGTAVYFGVDFDATASQYSVIGSYLDGAATVLGKDRTGLYAGFGPIDALVGVRCKYGWQTYGWSARRVSAKAHVYQYLNGQTLNGGSVDLCRTLQDDFGAFGGTTTTAGSGTPTLLKRKRDDMPHVMKRTEGTFEGSVAWPPFKGPSDLEDGYLVTTDPARFLQWERLYADGSGTADQLSRADYVAMQAVARLDRAGWVAGQPSAVAGVSPDLLPVESAVKGVSGQVAALDAKVSALPKPPTTFVAQ